MGWTDRSNLFHSPRSSCHARYLRPKPMSLPPPPPPAKPPAAARRALRPPLRCGRLEAARARARGHPTVAEVQADGEEEAFSEDLMLPFRALIAASSQHSSTTPASGQIAKGVCTPDASIVWDAIASYFNCNCRGSSLYL